MMMVSRRASAASASGSGSSRSGSVRKTGVQWRLRASWRHAEAAVVHVEERKEKRRRNEHVMMEEEAGAGAAERGEEGRIMSVEEAEERRRRRVTYGRRSVATMVPVWTSGQKTEGGGAKGVSREMMDNGGGGRVQGGENVSRRLLTSSSSSLALSRPNTSTSGPSSFSFTEPFSPATRQRAAEDDTQQLVRRLVSLRHDAAAAGRSRWQEALALVDSAHGRGKRLSTAAYNELLHALSRAGQIRRATEWFDRMHASGVRRSEKTYCIMVHAFARRGMPCSALRVFDDMLNDESGIEVSELAYATVFAACKSRGWVLEAMRLYNTMLEHGIRPSARSLVPLLAVCRRAKDPLHSMRVADDVTRFNVDMSARVITELAATFARYACHDELKALLDATLFFSPTDPHANDDDDASAEEVSLDAVACATILRSVRTLDDDKETLRRAVDAILSMQGLERDSVLHCTLIYSLGLLGESSRAQAYIEGLREAHGAVADPSLQIRSKDALVHALHGDLAGLERVFRGELPTSVVGYNVLIDTVWKSELQGEAVRLVGHACESGVFANTIVKKTGSELGDELSINLTGLSAGAAQAAGIYWMNSLAENPSVICDTAIIVGWGSKARFLLRDQYQGVSSLLASSCSPFKCLDRENPAVFIAKGRDLVHWLSLDKVERWGVEWLLY